MSEALTVLAFDTCGVKGSVALARVTDQRIVECTTEVELQAKTSASLLMPTVREMLKHAGVSLPALDAIIVVHGPGSFTGVRVGVSTAKGLAHASGCPLLAISRVVVLASQASAHGKLALLDAGRGEFYARYEGREWLASPDQVAKLARSGVSLLTAEESVAVRLAEWQPELAAPLTSYAAVHAAAERLLPGDWAALAALDANYLRDSDAELFARPVPPGVSAKV